MSANPRNRRRKLLGRLVIGFLALAVVIHMGGSWIIASQIRAGAFEVRHPAENAIDPESALGLNFSEVSYDSPLGPMPAWLVPGEPARPWVILVHGAGDQRSSWTFQIRTLHELGYTTLTITYRNDPGVPADPSGEYRMGLTEWEDLAGAVDFAVTQSAERIVLFGLSQGGAMVLNYLRHDPAPEVVATILDSPLLDGEAAVDHGAANLGIPAIGTLVWLAKQMERWRTGIAWSQFDYLQPSDYLHVPTLVFHGTADAMVSITDARELTTAHPGLVRLVESSSGHGGSWAADPQAYDAELESFLAELR
ncbi:MAG: alpha/beta hydrolase [Beutenbergiaceae bacterium]